MSGAGLVQLTGLTGKETESGMRLLMSSLLMKQIRLLFVFGMAVVLTSANAASAQVLNSFVERATAQGGPLAAGEAPAITDAKATKEEEEKDKEAQDDDLERRVDLLAEELERLRSGEDDIELSDDDARARGLAPSAAAVYRTNRGLSIAGYGEFLYENYAKTPGMFMG